MRKVVLYIAVSLDGYIADKDGGVGWLVGQKPENDESGSYPDFIQTVGAILLGYKTYHQVTTELAPGAWPYEGIQTYVLTHRGLKNAPGITFTSEDTLQLIDRLKSETGKDIWICGGASVVNPCIVADVIDQYRITIIPTILGGGIRLFDADHPEIKLRLIDTLQCNGMVELIYEKR